MPPATLLPPGSLVLPGDRVLSLSGSGAPAAPVRLGASLLADGDAVVATRAGVLRQAGGAGQRLWVEPLGGGAAGSAAPYAPAVGDAVLGVVSACRAEAFSVDIGAAWPATLPAAAFPLASRRNRPPLFPGSLVYARVASAPRDGEAGLACCDESGAAAAGLGPLAGGWAFPLPPRSARALLAPSGPQQQPHPALAVLGDALQFELAVGMNGRAWVDASGGGVRDTLAVARALQDAALMPPDRAAATARAAIRRLADAKAEALAG